MTTTATIPDTTRYLGKPAVTAQDAVGNVFYGFQAAENTTALVLQRPGAKPEVLASPAHFRGAPTFDVSPAGLFLVDSQGQDTRHLPERFNVKEYVPWGAGKIALPADSPVWALFTGTYKAADFDTDEEEALRVQKQLAALLAMRDALFVRG